MEVTLEELYQGKATLIGKKQYFSTADYIDPFIKRMSKFTKEFICKVKEPKQITIGDEKDITYNRVYVQAVLPKDYWEFENHQQVVGLIYGLDCKTPVVKLFRGGLNMACTNLCVFSHSYLSSQVLEPMEMYNLDPIERLMSLTDDLKVNIERLKNIYLSRKESDMQNTLGKWVDMCIRSEFKNDFGKAKLSPTVAISAYKDLMLDTKSSYYIPENQDNFPLFNAYNAFTEILRDEKDVISTVEKNLLLNQLLELC